MPPKLRRFVVGFSRNVLKRFHRRRSSAAASSSSPGISRRQTTQRSEQSQENGGSFSIGRIGSDSSTTRALRPDYHFLSPDIPAHSATASGSPVRAHHNPIFFPWRRQVRSTPPPQVVETSVTVSISGPEGRTAAVNVPVVSGFTPLGQPVVVPQPVIDQAEAQSVASSRRRPKRKQSGLSTRSKSTTAGRIKDDTPLLSPASQIPEIEISSPVTSPTTGTTPSYPDPTSPYVGLRGSTQRIPTPTRSLRSALRRKPSFPRDQQRKSVGFVDDSMWEATQWDEDGSQWDYVGKSSVAGAPFVRTESEFDAADQAWYMLGYMDAVGARSGNRALVLTVTQYHRVPGNYLI